ncbi:17-beta-hydroxysteroid dehydrogenase 14 isoform X2 [Salvelinus sp. IW2-2015]|uniref:17-beta-hydroxysteroid dehydrogenase 14 isoform X2 n=1 Tax=Salvelinus sp. IW2-2015 TaxID=2691554 RepID=UPI000CDFAFB8|nr:17-beta-hydroxysteroid dehydrogenase 14 isoform X2 [Salvelinus alpinus]XP_031683728.1 17-beta-hydroxysteroid dehydrogenase 14 isoform X4 [Oncorhynchus kisutch]
MSGSTLRYGDKVVIVTGGSKGIGRGIVKVFVENGAKVVFCARGVAAGQALEAELNRAGPGSCKFVPCDISKEEDIKYALPHLRQRQGNIINLSSLVGSIGQKNAAPYVATKGAIIAMTKAMAVDESRYQVRVNCISPGNVMTPLWEELAGQTADTLATIKEGENAQLLGRMGTEAESGLAALYLAADATFCTGIDLLLSGGAELNYGYKSQVP